MDTNPETPSQSSGVPSPSLSMRSAPPGHTSQPSGTPSPSVSTVSSEPGQTSQPSRTPSPSASGSPGEQLRFSHQEILSLLKFAPTMSRSPSPSTSTTSVSGISTTGSTSGT
jgi:hypothetical protein